MPGPRPEMRDSLQCGCARTDDTDRLVFKTLQSPVVLTACIAIVPATRVETVALESFDARNFWQFGIAQHSRAGNHEARGDFIIPVAAGDPTLRRLVST